MFEDKGGERFFERIGTSIGVLGSGTLARPVLLLVLAVGVISIFIPFRTTMVPEWQMQVVDVSGKPCTNMRVTESWGHYRLYLDGNSSSEDRFTDKNGMVRFPERLVRASIVQRVFMGVLTRIATIMHGGWSVEGVAWASGIKDVVWLRSTSDPLPSSRKVEKCIDDAIQQALGADSP